MKIETYTVKFYSTVNKGELHREVGGQQASTQGEEQCVVAPTYGPDLERVGLKDPLSPEVWTNLNNIAKPYLKTNKSERLGFLNRSTEN